jgi:hypothetical protein
MICSEKNGRLGKQFIRNLAVSLLAEKHDLKVNYSNKHLFDRLGIDLFSGSKTYYSIKLLKDENYFEIYNSDTLDCNLNPNFDYFQTKEITNFLYNYLNKYDIMTNIINNNPYKYRYNNNNDLYVHIRLTNAVRFNPGITYYINAIKNVKFDNLYISTDDKNHSMIIALTYLFPSIKLIEYDEIETFQFASTCKNIILSHGSFSAVIGYLSFFSTIYYPEFESNKIWHGDMFSINNWNKLSIN